MLFFAGFFAGLLREVFVVQYFKAVQHRKGLRGSALTLGIGLLDLVVIAKMAWDRNLWMAVGYIVGETIGTYLSIMAGK